MSAERFDVLILGGGLAGLSTALALTCATRLNVALVEMRVRSSPTIRAVYNDTIDKFGLQAAVRQPYTAMAFHSAGGSSARFAYGETESLSAVDYAHACALLRQRAGENGLILRPGRALRLVTNAGAARLLLAGGAELESQVLVDASGPAQWSARQLSVRRSCYVSRCYGERLAGCRVAQPQTFAFLVQHPRFGNGGGWFYPLGEDTVSAGFSLVTPIGLAPRDTAWRWAAARAEFPFLTPQLTGARCESIEGGAIPIGRVGHFCDDRILRVGDAAGQANPWSVEGCRPALENGRLAAQTVQHAFSTNRFDRTALQPYEEAWEQDNRERFWRTHSVAEITWGRSEAEWERFLRAYARLSPARQYQHLRENRTGFFGQVYSWLGYARRGSLQWLRRQIGGQP